MLMRSEATSISSSSSSPAAAAAFWAVLWPEFERLFLLEEEILFGLEDSELGNHVDAWGTGGASCCG